MANATKVCLSFDGLKEHLDTREDDSASSDGDWTPSMVTAETA